MDPVISIRPLLAVAVAGLAAISILLLNNRERLRDAVSPLAAIAMFAIVASMAPTVLAGGTVELRLFEILPGIDFAFRADALGMVFATVSSLLWIVAAFYSIGYMWHLNEHAQTRFFACFATSLGGRRGRLAANLFTLGDLYEVLSLVTIRLSTTTRTKRDGLAAQVPRLLDGRVEKRASRRAGADLPHCGRSTLWRGAAGGGRCLGATADLSSISVISSASPRPR